MSNLERRYGALRALAQINGAVGIVLLLIGGIALVVAYGGNAPAMGFLPGLGFLASSLVMFAISQSVYVVIDIEENTRRTTLLMESAFTQREAAPQVSTQPATAETRAPPPVQAGLVGWFRRNW